MTVSDWINLAIAIGTVGSCIVAVWLAYDSKRKKLDCVFVWREEENYKVIVSDRFYAWLAGFGSKAKIISPSWVVEDFKTYINKIQAIYEEDEK